MTAHKIPPKNDCLDWSKSQIVSLNSSHERLLTYTKSMPGIVPVL